MVLRGIVAIIFGLIALFWTPLTVAIFFYLFAFFVILSGILSIIFYFLASKRERKANSFILHGIVGIIIGIIAFAWPATTLTVLIYLVAAWAIITGIIELVAGFSIPWPEAPFKWVLGFAGLFSIVLGILIFVYPISSLAVITKIIGIYSIIVGILLFVFGLSSRKGAELE